MSGLKRGIMSPETRDAEEHIAAFTAAWNAHDVERLLGSCADEFAYLDPLRDKPIIGKDRFRKLVEAWFASFGEITYELDALVESGDRVAVLARLHGKHTGDVKLKGRTLPATNNVIDLEVAEFLKFDETGKLASEEVMFDTGALVAQISETGPSAPGA